jgi:isoleucyl-tRNA synthetase
MLRAIMSSPFYPVDTKQSFPKLEEKILAFWQTSSVFEESLAELDPQTGKPKPLFVFYEGPPTANGKPGIHHVLARAFKDVIPRYKTMRGYRVPRKAGWDCHGLPVEVEVEKRLGCAASSRSRSWASPSSTVSVARACSATSATGTS